MKKILILLVIFLIDISFAQLSVSLSGGFDPKEISLYNTTATDGINVYWNKGITIGTHIEYSLTEKFIAAGVFYYSHYNFYKYVDSGFRIPEISFISAEGKDANLWRTSVEIKFFPAPQSTVKFFVFSGIGIIIEDLGTIKTHFSNMDGSESTHTINSEINTSLVHSLGLGFRTNILSNLFVDASAHYYSNYSERFQTFFGVSLGYNIF